MEVHQGKMEQIFCQWSVELGLSPLSLAAYFQGRLRRYRGSECFLLASLSIWSPFTHKQLLSRAFSPALPKNSMPAALPLSFLRLTYHLLLTTSCPICSSVQLWATKTFHRAPQCLTNILENKYEIAQFLYLQNLHTSISTVIVKYTHSPTYPQ